MMQQQEQPLTVESLKRILANHDERLSRLENDKKAYGLDEIWTAKDVAQYAKILCKPFHLIPIFPQASAR